MPKKEYFTKQCLDCNKITGGKTEPISCLSCGSFRLRDVDDELPFGENIFGLIAHFVSDDFVKEIKELDTEDIDSLKGMVENYPDFCALSTSIHAVKVLQNDGSFSMEDIAKGVLNGVNEMKRQLSDD